MALLKSGTITDIEEFDDRYKLNFSLYYGDTCVPFGNMNIIYHNTNRFQNLMHVSRIEEFGEKEPSFGLLRDVELVMINDVSYAKLKLFMIIPKTNHNITKSLDEHYGFEVLIDEENPSLITLAIIDNKIKRFEKLKKIKDKICQT